MIRNILMQTELQLRDVKAIVVEDCEKVLPELRRDVPEMMTSSEQQRQFVMMFSSPPTAELRGLIRKVVTFIFC